MPDVIFIDGANGGAGATTAAVMLGAALSKEGERTLIVDGDAECSSALNLCGLQGLNVYTLKDAESGACRVKQAVLRHPRFMNLYVLSSAGCKNENFIESAVKECEGLFDRILCDKTAKNICSRGVIVCEPYPPSIAAAQKKAVFYKDGGLKNLQLLVNKINGGLVFSGAVLTPLEIASAAGVSLAGVIPEDLTLPLGKAKQSTLKAYAATARKIVGKDDKIYGVIRAYTGIKGLIKRRLRELV